jgi:hypothetical protein
VVNKCGQMRTCVHQQHCASVFVRYGILISEATHALCARKIFRHAPKTLTTPLINAFTSDREGCFRPSIDEKLLFRERFLESSKFIVRLSYQLLIISNNSCHSATDEFAVVPDLGGCSSPHSPSLDTPLK